MTGNNTGISKGIDAVTIWLYLLLVAVGIMAIFGATYRDGDPILSSFFSFRTDYSKQFYFFVLSITFGVFVLLTDSKFFTATANIWYAVGILLLLLVPLQNMREYEGHCKTLNAHTNQPYKNNTHKN